MLSANGGARGPSTTRYGAGGGGGGGFIHVPAQSITIGTTSVLGGAAGSNAAAVTAIPRCGGSGGGALAGNGGSGGWVQTNHVAGPANAVFSRCRSAAPDRSDIASLEALSNSGA